MAFYFLFTFLLTTFRSIKKNLRTDMQSVPNSGRHSLLRQDENFSSHSPICMYLCKFVCIRVWKLECESTCICVCVCVCVCMCVCVCVCESVCLVNEQHLRNEFLARERLKKIIKYEVLQVIEWVNSEKGKIKKKCWFLDSWSYFFNFFNFCCWRHKTKTKNKLMKTSKNK